MSIFKPAQNEIAFLKAGIMGFQGTGKTYTALTLAIGLHKHIKAKKPIMFLDSETGSSWGIDRCKKEGIELEVAKDKSFITLLPALAEAEENASILIIDSITHYWNELQQSYREAKGIKGRMAFHHWNNIKPQWHEFTDYFINSKVHVIICGRAGYEWLDEEDEDGITKSVKGGTKMKAEGEFGFEPNLVVEMTATKGKKKGDKYLHTAFVTKDRRQDEKSLDGKSFENPVFEHFLPHIESLNLGGDHTGVTKKGSKEMFIEENNGLSWEKERKLKNGYIEEFEGGLDFHYPGSTKENKVIRAGLKKYIFKTYSDTEIAGLDLTVLLDGLQELKKILESQDRQKIVDGIIEKLKNNPAEEKKTGEPKPEIKSNIKQGNK
jgi:hypothetical protein